MKKIAGLNRVISNIDGSPALGADGKQLLVRDALIQLIMSSQFPSARETILATRAAHKLYDAGDAGEVELEDYDFALVKRALEQNRVYTTLVMAALHETLGEVVD